MNTIKIATRKSPLALWQANYVCNQLKYYHPKVNVELVPMVTQGDVLLDSPLSKIGGKGLFVKQLEQAMLDYHADIAVHSIKDIPAQFPDGLMLATICKRDETRDALVSNHFKTLTDLPKGAVVGTSSLRRQCQLKALFPDLVIKDLRGNVGTRLSKLDQGEYDAIILAAVGLKRLELLDRIQQYIPYQQILPAVGQGAVGIETRQDDHVILELLAPLDDENTRYCITAERAMNNHLQGGCQVPIAANATLNGDSLTMQGLVGNLDGSQIIYATVTGSKQHAEDLGIKLAQQLIVQGADKILAQL